MLLSSSNATCQCRTTHQQSEEALLKGLLRAHLHVVDAVRGTLPLQMLGEVVKGPRVALGIALGEPKTAFFAGLHLGELILTIQLRCPLLRVDDL